MTDAFGSSCINVPPAIEKKAKDLIGRIMTVMEAATSPKKTAIRSVEGVVLKVSIYTEN